MAEVVAIGFGRPSSGLFHPKVPPMQYRLVYDVLNDGPPWLGVVFVVVPLLLAAACFLEILERLKRLRGRPCSPRPERPVDSLELAPFAFVIILFLLMGSVGVFFVSQTYEAFVQQKQCQEWCRTGQYEVVEGTIADYQQEGRSELPPRNLVLRPLGPLGRLH